MSHYSSIVALACCLHASDFCYIYTIQSVRSSTCHDPTDKITVASSLFCVIARPHTSHPTIFDVLGPFGQTDPFAGLPPSLLYRSYLLGRSWSLLRLLRGHCFAGSVG